VKYRPSTAAFGPRPATKPRLTGKLKTQIAILARDTVAASGLGGTPTPKRVAQKRSKKSKSR
jgi:hypothetical protein